MEETRRKAGKFIIFCLFMPRPARLNSLSSVANIPSHAKIVQQWWRVDVNWTSIRDELMERVFYIFLQFSEIPLSDPLKFCLRQWNKEEWVNWDWISTRERSTRDENVFNWPPLSPLYTTNWLLSDMMTMIVQGQLTPAYMWWPADYLHPIEE